MTEEKKDNQKQKIENTDVKAKEAVAKSVYGEKRGRPRPGMRGRREERREERPAEEFEQRIIDIARVTRVMAGGKRMRFRACVAIGNKKGKVAIGLAKGADVTMAVQKAVNKAKKKMINVPLVNDTIPHAMHYKYGAAEILMKPAKKGRGVIAGGAARVIFELAGVKDVTSKILGTNNKVNNVKCLIKALEDLKRVGVKKEEKIS